MGFFVFILIETYNLLFIIVCVLILFVCIWTGTRSMGCAAYTTYLRSHLFLYLFSIKFFHRYMSLRMVSNQSSHCIKAMY